MFVQYVCYVMYVCRFCYIQSVCVCVRFYTRRLARRRASFVNARLIEVVVCGRSEPQEVG
jgi:DNA primase large subunit